MVSAQYNVPWERKMHWDFAVLPFTPGPSLWPPSDINNPVLLIILASQPLLAEQNNNSSLLGEALRDLTVGSAAVSYQLYPLLLRQIADEPHCGYRGVKAGQPASGCACV